MADELRITGECRHGYYHREGDPCLGCGFCSIDGNDYSDMKKDQKPYLP